MSQQMTPDDLWVRRLQDRADEVTPDVPADVGVVVRRGVAVVPPAGPPPSRERRSSPSGSSWVPLPRCGSSPRTSARRCCRRIERS